MRAVPKIAAVSLTIALAAAATLWQATSQPTPQKRPRRAPPTTHDRMAYNMPFEAASFAVRKRTTGVFTRGTLSNDIRPLPVERYQAALEKMRRMWSHSTEDDRIDKDDSALSKWRELGPANIGGRTRQLLFDPRREEIMYAAAVAGGVWKTKDAGRSWEQLTDLAIPNIAVNALAIDPRRPDTLYAGTGEGYFNGDAVRGFGIFKTTDGGMRWKQLASTTGPDFFRVNDIVISPRDSKRLYASTRSGVWRSTNRGTTWTRVLDAASVLGCFDLAVQDGAEGFLFATCGSFVYGPQSGIYRVLDDVASGPWQQVYTEPDIGRISLAIAPSSPEVVYALAAEAGPGTYQNGLKGVFRSLQSGAQGTWTTQVRNTDPNKLNTVLLTNPVYAFLQDCGFGGANAFFNQGWYDNVIAVDPLDPDRVWTGGIDLFRSDDGGRNWGVASYWWFSGGVDGTPFDPNYAHADNHVIAFHPKFNGTTNRAMYVTSDGGIFQTADARANVGTTVSNVCGDPTPGSVTWKSLNNDYAVTQFYHGAVYPDGDTFFGGTQDNGTIHGTLKTRDVWRQIQGGDGGYVAVDPTNTDVLFAEFFGLSIRRSRDGGVTFDDATSGIADPGFAFIAPFYMNPARPQQLFTGGWYIWRTVDQADSWQRASAIAPGVGSVSALGASTLDSDRWVVGMSDGYLLFNHAANAASGTTEWQFSRPRPGFVSSVHWDPASVDVVYATYATFNTAVGQFHVYRSGDGGRTWSGLDGSGDSGIPDIPAHSIVVDPSNTARLYLGTDSGVFASIDGGMNWFKEATGYANVVTESLALSDARRPQLYAFTHGRSAWRVRLRKD